MYNRARNNMAEGFFGAKILAFKQREKRKKTDVPLVLKQRGVGNKKTARWKGSAEGRKNERG